MNMMHSTILNAQVANQVRNSMGHTDNDINDDIENTCTPEDERFEMWMALIAGVMFSIGYIFLILPETNWFINAIYGIFYFIDWLFIMVVAPNKEQPLKARKTSLLLSVILTIVVFAPYLWSNNWPILDIAWCVFAILYPLFKLYRLKN